MANPQPEPFVRFSKELFDAILRSPLEGTHLQIVLCVIRRTYGDYGKRSAPISLRMIRDMLGRSDGSRAWIIRCLDELVTEGVIGVIKPASFNSPRVLALNKDYESWGRFSVAPVRVEAPVRVDAPVRVEVGTSTRGRTTPVRVDAPIEDKSRQEETREDPPISPPDELITESEPPPDPFDAFWAAWPNRHGTKAQTRKRFKILSPSQQEGALVAEQHLAAAMTDGRLPPEYQPRAENFVGGTKEYWREWENGPPARYANPRSRDISSAEFNELAAVIERGEMEVIEP